MYRIKIYACIFYVLISYTIFIREIIWLISQCAQKKEKKRLIKTVNILYYNSLCKLLAFSSIL